jgi:hypothetical protein
MCMCSSFYISGSVLCFSRKGACTVHTVLNLAVMLLKSLKYLEIVSSSLLKYVKLWRSKFNALDSPIVCAHDSTSCRVATANVSCHIGAKPYLADSSIKLRVLDWVNVFSCFELYEMIWPG